MKPPTLPLTLVATLISCTLTSPNSRSAQVDESFTTQVNGPVYAISVNETGNILIGGAFSEVNGATHANLAKLSPNGAPISGTTLATDGPVFAFATQSDGSTILGGGFGSPTRHVARLLPDGTFAPLFLGSSTSSRVNCLATGPDDSIALGGSFWEMNGNPSIYATRLTATGSIDSSFTSSLQKCMSIEAGTDAIAVQPDGKIIVGGNVNTPVGFATLVRLNTDGSVDGTFDGDHGPILYPKAILALDDGKIIVGGVPDPFGKGFVRRLNADGSVDPTFNEATFNYSVETIALEANGDLLVGGGFAGGLARLHADGTVDASWDVATDGWVSSIALQSDGAAIIGGTFTKVGDSNHAGIARIKLKPEQHFATNANGRFSARLLGDAGKNYEIQASTNLTSWTVIGTTVATDAGILIDDDSAGTKTLRFFRARRIN